MIGSLLRCMRKDLLVVLAGGAANSTRYKTLQTIRGHVATSPHRAAMPHAPAKPYAHVQTYVSAVVSGPGWASTWSGLAWLIITLLLRVDPLLLASFLAAIAPTLPSATRPSFAGPLSAFVRLLLICSLPLCYLGFGLA